jgi:5-methyltetrahydrofolate--homocysteine methyltransferase
LRNFLNEINGKVLLYDGSKGYMLEMEGLKGSECAELWNIKHPEIVSKIYSLYKDAGSDVIQTNTFQGNRESLAKYSLGDKTYELNFAGAKLAKDVMGGKGFVAASIGPIGKLFEPSGELTFNKAYEVFKEQILALVDGGVDVINFETFTDLAEMRAALIAAQENSDLPVICSLAFEENGKTLMGTDPHLAGIVLKSLGADIIGANCSFGPEHMLDIIKEMSKTGGIPLAVKPNAGLPELECERTIYDESPSSFSKYTEEFVNLGVRLIGGCCGTTPEFIKEIRNKLKKVSLPEIYNFSELVITSSVKSLNLQKTQISDLGNFSSANIDDEIFNMCSKNDFDAITEFALDLSTEEHEAVYVNVDSVSEGRENLLANVVNILQGYIKDPLIIETENEIALKKALRIYKGKAGVVIGIGTQKNVEELIFTARKYGSTVIEKSLIDNLKNNDE